MMSNLYFLYFHEILVLLYPCVKNDCQKFSIIDFYNKIKCMVDDVHNLYCELQLLINSLPMWGI